MLIDRVESRHHLHMPDPTNTPSSAGAPKQASSSFTVPPNLPIQPQPSAPKPTDSIRSAPPASPTLPPPTSIPRPPIANTPVKPLQPLPPSPLKTPITGNPSPLPTNPANSQSTTPTSPSSLRTMQSDISALNQGKAPTGVPIDKSPATPVAPKPSGPIIKPAPGFGTPNLPPLPTQPATPPQRTTGLPPLPSSIPPLQPASPSITPISIPDHSGGSSKILVIVLIIILVVGGGGFGIWYFIQNRATPVAVSPTPSPTESSTPSPAPLTPRALFEKIFGQIGIITLPTTNPLAAIRTALASSAAIPNAPASVFQLHDETGTQLTFSDVVTRLKIPVPTTVDLLSFNSPDWIVGSFHQQSNTGHIERPVIIIPLNDTGAAKTALTAWEPSLSQDLGSLLGYTIKKPIPFKEDFYNGLSFRYVQVPDKDSGLAYTIVNNSLVIASSRDSFRYIVDALQQP